MWFQGLDERLSFKVESEDETYFKEKKLNLMRAEENFQHFHVSFKVPRQARNQEFFRAEDFSWN